MTLTWLTHIHMMMISVTYKVKCLSCRWTSRLVHQRPSCDVKATVCQQQNSDSTNNSHRRTDSVWGLSLLSDLFSTFITLIFLSEETVSDIKHGCLSVAFFTEDVEVVWVAYWVKTAELNWWLQSDISWGCTINVESLLLIFYLFIWLFLSYFILEYFILLFD